MDRKEAESIQSSVAADRCSSAVTLEVPESPIQFFRERMLHPQKPKLQRIKGFQLGPVFSRTLSESGV